LRIMCKALVRGGGGEREEGRWKWYMGERRGRRGEWEGGEGGGEGRGKREG